MTIIIITIGIPISLICLLGGYIYMDIEDAIYVEAVKNIIQYPAQ
jgi:TM2 domain-containing membrane protein YozV